MNHACDLRLETQLWAFYISLPHPFTTCDRAYSLSPKARTAVR